MWFLLPCSGSNSSATTTVIPESPESKANKTYQKQPSQDKTCGYVSPFDEVIIVKDVTLLTVYVSPLEPTHEALQSARSAIH